MPLPEQRLGFYVQFYSCGPRTITQLLILQPPDILTSHPAKLQPRAVRYSRNLPLDPLSLSSQQRFLKRLPPSPKSSQHDLKLIHIDQHPSLVHLAHGVARQLISRVKRPTLRFPKPNIASREGEHGLAIGSRQREMRVVFRSINM